MQALRTELEEQFEAQAARQRGEHETSLRKFMASAQAAREAAVAEAVAAVRTDAKCARRGVAGRRERAALTALRAAVCPCVMAGRSWTARSRT